MRADIPNYMPDFRENRLKVLEEQTAKYGFGEKGRLGIKLASVSKENPIQLGVIACRDFKVGEKIISSRPYAHVTEPKTRCDGCHKTKEEGLEKLSLCGGCSFYAYCSRKCQALMWPVHKFECKKLLQYKMIAGQFPSKTTRLCARLILTARLNQTENGTLEIIDKMIDIKDDSTDIGMAESVDGLSKFTITLLQDDPGKLEFYKAYLSKFSPNGMAHGTPDNTLITPLISFFNHSCDANGIIHQQDLVYSVYANKPIKKGEEIFFNYRSGDNNAELNKILKEVYKIDCHCDKCTIVQSTGSLDQYYRCKDTVDCNGRVDIRNNPISPPDTIGICLKCSKTYPTQTLISQGAKIKDNLKKAFAPQNATTKRGQILALNQYFEHFDVMDGELINLLYGALIDLDIPFIIKRIELFLIEKHGINSELYFTFVYIVGPRYFELGKSQLASYYLDKVLEFDRKFNLIELEHKFALNHMLNIGLEGVKADKSAFGTPDKYFDSSIKY
ncbi:hypothetical protein CYY_004857 [Polysphondylium violaceum]|uniref:SET domain-containing protein n=1 Tax=Polysphondylium violaceum TaxID=133409 RepID=A0A8J4UYZ9_9MYCE|nr:hypothetical protein CYY_004857 [Polysphondylium violaceum]